MTSRTTKRFRERLAALPHDVRRQAAEAYKRFAVDPGHPGLRFKQVHPTPPVWSARISRDYRAVGVIDEGAIVWFWVGNHSDYEELLKQL